MDGGAWWAAVHGVTKSRTRGNFTFTFTHWRRKWQPTPVLLPEKSHGWRSRVGCSPWVAKSLTRLKRLSSSSSILYWCFSFWLTSLCIISSSFIHLIRTESNVFFLMAEKYSIVYTYHCFLIHSSADGHLGCFHVLATINSAAINSRVHVSLSILVSSVCMPSSGIAGS